MGETTFAHPEEDRLHVPAALKTSDHARHTIHAGQVCRLVWSRVAVLSGCARSAWTLDFTTPDGFINQALQPPMLAGTHKFISRIEVP